MSINLSKGQNICLDKTEVNVNQIQVGLGWDIKADSTVKDEFDLDVFGIIVDQNDKGATEENLFFYNNVDGKGTKSTDAYAGVTDINGRAKEILKTSVIVPTKDNLTGEGDGDDETMFINASLLTKDKKAIIVVNIYEADKRKQAFGIVNNSYARILSVDGSEFCRYDLKEDFSIESGVIIGEIYWSGEEVKIRAIGKGFSGDLNALFSQYK